jgi:hypothetical protein
MEEKKKLRIKVQKGDLAVEMEGSEEYIKELLGEDTVRKLGEVVKSELEKSEAPGMTSENPEIKTPTSAIDSYEKTGIGRIKYLIDKGFFDKPRSLAETTEQLARIGFPYDAKTIDNSLRFLLKKPHLRRLGIRGEYRYVRP